MFLRSFRFGRRPPAAGFATYSYFPFSFVDCNYLRAFLRPATVFFGPFRVRALVRVR